MYIYIYMCVYEYILYAVIYWYTSCFYFKNNISYYTLKKNKTFKKINRLKFCSFKLIRQKSKYKIDFRI